MPKPLVEEIAYQDPVQLFSCFSEREGALFFDSAEKRAACGRYSFIAFDPFLTLECKAEGLLLNQEPVEQDPFELLEKLWQCYRLETLPGLPPFQTGVAGYWSYEMAHYLEELPRVQEHSLGLPDLVLGFYDCVLAFDQEEQRAWLFSSGFPELEEKRRQSRAKERLAEVLSELEKPDAPLIKAETRALSINAGYSAETYHEKVQSVIDYILAGDIFQANLSMPFYAELPQAWSAFETYRRLRKINPAPFAAYLHFGDFQILSASPERFLQVRAGKVETRPIKGTAARASNPLEDAQRAQALLASTKDQAENVMIVDLLRNDLSRVCENHSVQVPKLCALESYATVHHLVSVVEGVLAKGKNELDLLKACFPGGSITGAPKCRAMEIIAELEAKARGPYCGALLYWGFDGAMDSAITIRTLVRKGSRLVFQAGGAVVLDSSPEKEYEEVLLKVKALIQALGGDDDRPY